MSFVEEVREFNRIAGTEEKFYPIKEKSGSVQRRTDSFQD